MSTTVHNHCASTILTVCCCHSGFRFNCTSTAVGISKLQNGKVNHATFKTVSGRIFIFWNDESLCFSAFLSLSVWWVYYEIPQQYLTLYWPRIANFSNVFWYFKHWCCWGCCLLCASKSWNHLHFNSCNCSGPNRTPLHRKAILHSEMAAKSPVIPANLNTSALQAV